MHEKRNFVLTLLLSAAVLWTLFNWLIAPEFFRELSIPMWLKVASLLMAAALGGALFIAYRYEDPLEDDLARITGGRYYEHDGLCFMPLIRVVPGGGASGEGQAEISLYYQNRYSNGCEAVIHLRPPIKTFATHRGARDVHFAFKARPGGPRPGNNPFAPSQGMPRPGAPRDRADAGERPGGPRPGGFGVVHQAIAVHPKAQGQEIEVELAAAVRWPMSHGDELRSHSGMACGTFEVDWALAYRQGEHELCGEIELHNPVTLHITMPLGVKATCPRHNESTQETITAVM